MGTWDNIRTLASDMLFPRRCPLCGTLLRPNERMCGKCSDGVVHIHPPTCPKCARPIYDCVCRRGDEYVFERCVAPFAYTKAIRGGIHRLKFSKISDSAEFFALFMTSAVRREYRNIRFDMVLCVPMHPSDIHKRGYNQADLIAKSVAERLSLPYHKRALTKTMKTEAQRTLPRADRRSNVAGVFAVPVPHLVAGKTILLCDDIITTGATLEACTHALLGAGARAVYCVTAAAVVGSEERSIKRAYL